jgi:ABC-type sugar transport system substrate-binding protein
MSKRFVKARQAGLVTLALLAVCITLIAALGASAFAADKKQLVIASLVQPMDNPWVVNNVKFQKAVAKALGIKLIVVTDQGTEDSNIAAMQALIARQPDGILFDPITEAAGREDAKLLEQADILSVTEDRLVVPDISGYKGKMLLAQVTQSNRQWGYDMMMALINQGSTKIVAIMDPHGVTTVEEAWQGAEKAVQDHPGVKVLQESWQPKSRENAIATMDGYLARYAPGQVDGCWCIGSTVGLGALHAIEQAGRQKQIRVSTADDDIAVIKAIESGELTSTLGGHWMNGGFGLIVLYDGLNGHKPLSRQPSFNLITVTKTNAAKYAARFLNSQPFTDAQIRQMSQVYNPKADLPAIMANLKSTWQNGGQ